MSKKIHPTAIISPYARLDSDVVVGPYVVIGDGVSIGRGTTIDAFTYVVGNTRIGKNCRIFSHAALGNIPQDLKYKDEKTSLIIGDNNIIREGVTIHLGTAKSLKTIIGNNNLFMAYSHIAHDCRVGDNNVFANCATLAGHVEIGNRVTVGGLAAVHQFCRIADLAIIGGCSKVVQDIPPYAMCDGHPAGICGINLVGLRRAGYPASTISHLRKAFKFLFFDGHTLDEAKELVKENLPSAKEIDYLLTFILSSKRGIAK